MGWMYKPSIMIGHKQFRLRQYCGGCDPLVCVCVWRGGGGGGYIILPGCKHLGCQVSREGTSRRILKFT